MEETQQESARAATLHWSAQPTDEPLVIANTRPMARLQRDDGLARAPRVEQLVGLLEALEAREVGTIILLQATAARLQASGQPDCMLGR